MNYLTNRGEFATLQLLRAAYLDAPDWQKFWIDARTITEQPWTKGLFHASDVGGCPRATMYRLLGTPEKPRSEKSKANRKVMFWAGYHFHYLTYSALNWAGILLYHEEPVKLPDGWTGTLDAEIVPLESDTFIFDEKTVMPNMLNHYGFDLPRLPNCLQLTVYGDAVDNLNGLIEYTDRAGSNDPEECFIDLSQHVAEKNARMVELERCRDALPDLPPELDQTYVPHYTRNKSDPDWMVMKTIAVETPWNCGYCDYHLTREESRVNPASGRMKKYSWTQPESTCHPQNVPPVDVAELSPVGTLISCKSGHEVGAEIVTRTKPLRYYSPQDES